MQSFIVDVRIDNNQSMINNSLPGQQPPLRSALEDNTGNRFACQQLLLRSMSLAILPLNGKRLLLCSVVQLTADTIGLWVSEMCVYIFDFVKYFFHKHTSIY
jgi:hypothetical protein